MHEILNNIEFNNWLSSALGSYLVSLQIRWISKYLLDQKIGSETVVLGPHQVIVDMLLKGEFVDKTHLIIIKSAIDNQSSVVANYGAIPLTEESIDTIVLPHILDSFSCPLEILSEAYRILKPEGKLYITCFNKLSLWGLYKFFVKLFLKTPWQCRFTTFLELEDWLGELGFDIISSRSVGYCLPFNYKKLISLQTMINKITPTITLPFGAINLLEVRKRVIPLTLESHLVVSKVVNEFGING